MRGHGRWALAVILAVLLGALPAQAAAQDADLPYRGNLAAGLRIGFGQIPFAEPAGTFPVGLDGEFFLSDFFSVGSEFLFLTANGSDRNRGMNLIFYWDVFVKLHLVMPDTGIPELDTVQPYFRVGLGLADVDAEDRDSPYVDFAMPFAFGVDYWVMERDQFGLGFQMEFATYVTGISSESVLPNNSVITPWLWTVGVRLKFQ